MKNKSLVSLFFSMMILISNHALATNKNAGTSGAQFLKIGTGARPTGMGESFVAIADDIYALHYNPAGLTQLKSSELTAMHTQWFEGLTYEYGAYAMPTSHGTWGVSVTTLKSDKLEKRSVDEATNGTFETMDSAYTMSYARNLFPDCSIGLTGRFIQEKIDTTSAKGWGGDIGLHYAMQSRPLSVGFAAKNMGSGIKFNSESDPQPLMLDAGVAHKSFGNKLLIGVDVKKARDADVKYGMGVEWKQPLRNDFRFSLRGGLNSAQTDAGGSTGLSFGAGVGFRRFDIDFAWVPLGDLGNTFRYAAVLRF